MNKYGNCPSYLQTLIDSFGKHIPVYSTNIEFELFDNQSYFLLWIKVIILLLLMYENDPSWGSKLKTEKTICMYVQFILVLEKDW